MSSDPPAVSGLFLSVNDSRVHALRFGHGPELLVCFHGFGDRAHLFRQLEEALSGHFTVYAVDLPYHGLTQWEHDLYGRSDIVAIIDAIRKRESTSSFSLMGYSYGGRIVQALLDDFAGQLRRLFLIAPDGIATRWLFNATLAPQWFRHLVRRALRQTGWFISLAGRLRRLGLISAFIHDFAVNHVGNEERRRRLFSTWLSFNDFKIQPRKSRRKMKALGIPVYLFFGKRDEIIRPEAGHWLKAGLPEARLFILDEGHLLVGHQLNRLLKEILT